MTKFNVGDSMLHAKYGVGVVKKVDKDNPDFYYFTDFTAKGGDGTKVWLPKYMSNKVASKIA